MNLPKVAVVILNWNGRKFLEQFLPFLMKSSYGSMEVILADNASTDDSLSFMSRLYPDVRIIQNAKNEGFAQGYNIALRQVEADYYVLLNSDVEVVSGWLEPMVALMEGNKEVGACQPKLRAYDSRDNFEYAGACGGWIDSLGYPFSRGRVFDVCEQDLGQYEDAVPCFWATGAALMIRSELYHKVGGLDPYFFAHQEEIDLCWRIQRAGYMVFSVPQSVVYHVGGGTLPRGNTMKVYLNFRNNLIMLAKNLPFSQAIIKIPIRFGLDALAAWKGVFEGNGGYYIAIAKAHMHFFKWLILGKKHKGVKGGKGKNLSGYYNGCVIWDYFIRKKRTFTEIVKLK
jgi:GT2 family glycosyltransferase